MQIYSLEEIISGRNRRSFVGNLRLVFSFNTRLVMLLVNIQVFCILFSDSISNTYLEKGHIKI